MGAEKKIEAAAQDAGNDNLRIWNAVCKTDPAQTKGFKRAGGFSGTAVKPMWVIKRLTEQFGPCGQGWGIGEPSFQVVPGDNREMLVYCTVACWHTTPDNVIYGVGGDKIVTHIKADQQYNRPERWENDDEAFKKAFTDAVNNAFKFVGVAADIHMGQFDDSKYVAQVRQEFAAEEAQQRAGSDSPTSPANHHEDDEAFREPAPREKLDGPHTSKTALRKAVNEVIALVRGAGDIDALEAIKADHKRTINQARRDWPALIDGDPRIGEDLGLKGEIEKRRSELCDSTLTYQLLVSTLNECLSSNDLVVWLSNHGSAMESLDGEESRSFERLYQQKEAAVRLLDQTTVGA